MDKNRKLRRYNRKDYTQVVEFPVEIVGRDGIVRRYSFEESIRLYQRRIASAGSRYGDQDIAQAEMEHCRRRIDQLRRSYLERYGGSAMRRLDDLDGMPGLAGEVTAFLRRCFDPDHALDRVQVEEIGILDDCQVYGVRLEPSSPSLILYLYAFDGEATTCPARDAFFAQVKLLQQLRNGGEGLETLVAFHHMADYGLVLTGSGAVARELADRAAAPEDDDLGPIEEPDAGPHSDAMTRLRAGDAEGALRAFERSYERDHYRRTAYIGAAVVADQLGHFDRAGLAAEMGSRYFVDDPSMAWHLAVAHLRRGDVQAAHQALARAQAYEADAHAVHVLRALIALRRGHLQAGRRLLHLAADLPAGPDESLARTRRRLRLSLAALSAMRLLALVGAAASCTAVVRGSGAAGVGAVAFVALFLAAVPLWRGWLRLLVAMPGRTGLSLASPATLSASGRRASADQ